MIDASASCRTTCLLGWVVALLVTACAGHPVPDADAPALGDEPGEPPRPIRLAESGFERVGEVGGVVVYEQPSSSLIRIGAEGRLPAPPDEVLTALLEYDRHAAVLERVAESRVLERGSNWLLLYQRLSLPIVSDRDLTLRVTWGKRDGGWWIRYRAVPGGPPPTDGVVRITRDTGGWDLEPVEEGHATWARYQSSLDLGGSLPTWVTQSGATDELPSLFRATCQLLPVRYESRCAAP